jgi:hypothetical protein
VILCGQLASPREMMRNAKALNRRFKRLSTATMRKCKERCTPDGVQKQR